MPNYNFPLATYLVFTYMYSLLSVLCLPIDSLHHVFLAYYMTVILIRSSLSLHVYAYNVCGN